MATQPSADLQSKEHRALFDIIDKLRSHGIGQHVDLPEIIVCGDQSAGKSSVLEAISGHPFPTKDGLCTRFVTELVLRREPTPKFNVSIIPGPERSDDDAFRLSLFSDSVSADATLDVVIEQAKNAMGLSSSKRFSTDRLRVEISGPDQAHLTMVDLPGLFRAGSSEQSIEDVKTVNNMVRQAMRRPRSIILAVVSASNEFNNQEVTELARKMDPERVRTLGLITKPDKLDEGSETEKSYIRLARNEDVVLDLGWHVLRNRGHEMNGTSTSTRDEVEQNFFSKGVWRSLDPSQLGVAALRKRLSAVLGRQILRHLPTLREDVAGRIRECEQVLSKLGDSRETPEQQRRYLLGVSSRFTSLMAAAVDGNYSDVFFGDPSRDEEYRKYIRAMIQNTLRDFAERMHREGKSQTIVDDDEEVDESEPRPASPVYVSRSVYIKRVAKLMERTKGRELPGMFNPFIVRELFVDQCRPWKDIAAETTASITQAATWTALAILRHVALDKTLGGISVIVKEGIEKLKGQVDSKVEELLAPHYEGHPITYNHYLTDIVQKTQAWRRERAYGRLVTASFEDRVGTSLPKSEVTRLFTDYHKIEQDMEKQASGQAVDYSEAYYKVALRRFVDELSDLAVERQLIRFLPELFNPATVYDLTDEQVAGLAAEDEEAIAERARRRELLSALQTSMVDLMRLDRGRTGSDAAGLFQSPITEPYTASSPTFSEDVSAEDGPRVAYQLAVLERPYSPVRRANNSRSEQAEYSIRPVGLRASSPASSF